jgi:retinol dehydrogenase-12
MQGKTCMITGASSGIGRATALALAEMGATLVLICRDRGRGEETVAEIAATTGNRDVLLLLADLSAQAEVRRVAADFLATDRPLHVLINNAGVVNLQRSVTVDGIETTFAVNHLAYFLLTELLLERLRRSAPARIINVASDAHKFGRLDFDDLNNERRYRAMRAYGQSKLANILFTTELAQRLAGSGVTANSVHPGAVATGLGKNNGAWARALIRLLRPFFRTPSGGAATSIYLASSPDVDGVSGKYFANCREHRPSRAARDADAARRLWNVSARMVGL